MKRMEYADIKALLSPLIDGELDPETMHAVERTLSECEKSRALVDEAEALNDLIVRDAQELGGASTGLPAGFADAVLNRTVRPTYVAPTPYFRQWTTWSGWFAAAACLALAVTIYVRNSTPDNMTIIPAESASSGAQANNGADEIASNQVTRSDPVPGAARLTNWSWTHNDLQTVGHPLNDNADSPATVVIDGDADDPAEDFFSGADLRHMQHPFPLPSPEVATLEEVANVMELIAHLNIDDADAINTVLHQISNDDLVNRLEEVRMQLQYVDQSSVFSAESILRILVEHDVQSDDFHRARENTRLMELPAQIREISERVSARLDL